MHLSHHGILGQKWGVRRFQNADGSYTTAGKKRYGNLSTAKQIQRRLNDVDQAMAYNASDYNSNRDKSYASYVKGRNLFLKGDSKNGKKFWDKSSAYNAKKAVNEANFKKGEAEKKKLIARAKKLNLDVSAKEVERSVMRGSDWLALAGISVITGATAAAIVTAKAANPFVPANTLLTNTANAGTLGGIAVIANKSQRGMHKYKVRNKK